MELGDLAHVLERRAALALNHDARARRERVQHRLDRLRQAGGDEDEQRIGQDHGIKKTPQSGDRHRLSTGSLCASGLVASECAALGPGCAFD